MEHFLPVFVNEEKKGFFGLLEDKSKLRGNRSLIEVEGFHFKRGYGELRKYCQRNKEPEPPVSIVSTVVSTVNEAISSVKKT